MSGATPKRLTDRHSREMARGIRDSHWRFMEQVAAARVLWWCTWDKAGRHYPHRYRTGPPSPFVYVSGLIDAGEIFEWIGRHNDWWRIGKWNEEAYAFPVRLTKVGREALQNRALYDMEPVTGGMVEPGWICTPMPPQGGTRQVARG